MEKSTHSDLIPRERIADKIYLIRGKKVMIDSDLAKLYQVETKQLKRAVRRNIERFPQDFMFALVKEESLSLRSQIGTLEKGRHAKYLAYAFTEHGILMLSSVLNSKQAIQVNIQIMRTFTRLRELMATNAMLRRQIEEVERTNDRRYANVFRQLKYLLDAEDRRAQEPPKEEIGFRSPED